MKRIKFFVIPFIPFIYQYICSTMLRVRLTNGHIPPFAIRLYFFMQFVFPLLWYIAGRIYSKLEVSKPIAILLGNSVSLTFLGVYIWQFFSGSDLTKIDVFTPALYLGQFVVVRVVSLFKLTVFNNIGKDMNLLGQVLFVNHIVGYLIMVLIFTFGLLRKSHLDKEALKVTE